MISIFGLKIMYLVLEKQCTYSAYLSFHWMDILDISHLILKK